MNWANGIQNPAAIGDSPPGTSLSLAVKTSTIASIIGLALVIFLAGCALPYSESGVRAVYARTTQDGRTNEVLVVVAHYYGWGAPLTPEGPQYITSNCKMHYYFSNQHLKGRSLGFLVRPGDNTWEVFAPVEGTNFWVRVEGPHATSKPSTTNLFITVFTPRRSLYQQSIETRDVPDVRFLHFAEGNRVLAYKSENDEFVYDVLERCLKTKSAR